MMEILAENLGRRYNQEWIFRGVDFKFESNNAYAILGPNGAGKSTFLRVLSGSLGSSEGKIRYHSINGEIEPDDFYKSVAISAPYLELIEEFTLSEILDFHFEFKNFVPGLDKTGILDLLKLSASLHKPLKYFSSGMKQRTKLVLAICSASEVVILDEPTANLDKQGVDWYHDIASKFLSNKLTVIGSNQEHEYSFCNNLIQITDYKSKP